MALALRVGIYFVFSFSRKLVRLHDIEKHFITSNFYSPFPSANELRRVRMYMLYMCIVYIQTTHIMYSYMYVYVHLQQWERIIIGYIVSPASLHLLSNQTPTLAIITYTSINIFQMRIYLDDFCADDGNGLSKLSKKIDRKIDLKKSIKKRLKKTIKKSIKMTFTVSKLRHAFNIFAWAIVCSIGADATKAEK